MSETTTVDQRHREALHRSHERVLRDRVVPADALLHPAPLAAVGVLLLNDHVLKAAWPGIITGKLSDVAGLAFFPLVLLGIWEVGLASVGRWSGPRHMPLLAAVLVTGLVFTLVKATAEGALVFGWTLAAGQRVLTWPVMLATGSELPPLVPARVIADPTDLLALPALAIALWVGAARLARARTRALPGDAAQEEAA